MSKEAGFDAHLAKPPSIEALQRVIAEVTNTRPELPRAEMADRGTDL
jgi:hypothetical protein